MLLSYAMVVGLATMYYAPNHQASHTRARRAHTHPIMNDANARIDQLVSDNKVFLFMKGNKMFPQCGFSNTAVQILNAIETPYETFDVLSDETIREGVKQ